MNQSLQNATHVERMDHLFQVVKSKQFLEKQGLGNEVPFFICPFKANEAVEMEPSFAKRCARAFYQFV